MSPSFIAAVHAVLGEAATALDYLERAYGKRNLELMFLRVQRALDSLKSEPRFIRLVEKLGPDTPAADAVPG